MYTKCRRKERIGKIFWRNNISFSLVMLALGHLGSTGSALLARKRKCCPKTGSAVDEPHEQASCLYACVLRRCLMTSVAAYARCGLLCNNDLSKSEWNVTSAVRYASRSLKEGYCAITCRHILRKVLIRRVMRCILLASLGAVALQHRTALALMMQTRLCRQQMPHQSYNSQHKLALLYETSIPFSYLYRCQVD